MKQDPSYEEQLLDVFECLRASGHLRDVILIGSWADYMYTALNLLSEYDPIIKTLDADFLISGNNSQIDRTFIDLLKEHGFQYKIDYYDNVSNILGRYDFTVDFIIPQKGDGSRQVGQKSSLGIIPQVLSHMDILANNPIAVTYKGYNIKIPEPEAFLIHKIIINHRRDPLKAVKDQSVITRLLHCVSLPRVFQLTQDLSNKEKSWFSAYIQNRLGITDIRNFKQIRTDSSLSDTRQDLAKTKEKIQKMQFPKPNTNIISDKSTVKSANSLKQNPKQRPAPNNDEHDEIQ